MVRGTNTDDLSPNQPSEPVVRCLAETVLIVLVFFIVAGDPPPHVNEAHYLCRLKHYWNPNWSAGDLFLESKDTQLVFIWTFGWITRLLSLPVTAWVGRMMAWTLIAWSWQRLGWRVVPRPLAAVLSAVLFVALNEHAHLAGEWVVGGVEAKCFAYGFVLLALRELIDVRWNRVWPLLGIATAFHPLVGGWSMVVCAGIWLLDDRRTVTPRSMLPGLLGGALLALVGVLPALLLTWNEPPELVGEANRIYVFDRLPHHLALLSLPAGEVARRLGGHAALLILLWRLVRAMRNENTSIRRIANFAWGAALLAAIGFAIELALWNQPLIAARLLRYYWFRLTDFAAPMAVAIGVTSIIAMGIKRRRAAAVWGLVAAVVLSGFQIANVATRRALNPVPPADEKIRDFHAWVDACEWVTDNTPADALFLTPRLNLTFKWRAGRPEVVNRKDIPQDPRGIIEWHRRVKEIYYATIEGVEQPLDSLGILGTDRVRELALKYGADYVLMDRGQLLSLPIAFWNDEYVVYEIKD